MLARLTALVDSQDGFDLAQRDLDLRGPGELYGLRQSGIPELKMTEFNDYKTIKLAQDEASSILAKDPQLDTFPGLKAKVLQLISRVHLE